MKIRYELKSQDEHGTHTTSMEVDAVDINSGFVIAAASALCHAWLVDHEIVSLTFWQVV